MRSFVLGALLVATAASSASAQITFSSQAFDIAGPFLVDFDAPIPTGIVLTNGQIRSGLSSGNYAPPAGVTNNYFASPGSAALPGAATIDFTAFINNRSISSLSFYWGSIDQYNDLGIFGVGGTLASINGASVVPAPNPANGNQFIANTNRRITLTFAGDDRFNFRGLALNSSRRSFEIDNIDAVFVDGFQVPEPATASVLALGLAMLGAAGARRKRNTA